VRVVFRTDSSLEIGNGHLMRCLTLALVLRSRGVVCSFISRNLPGNGIRLILSNGFDVSVLASPSRTVFVNFPQHASWAGVDWQQDLEETLSVLQSVDWLVVDHYSFDARWERGVREYVGKILVIDDLSDRSHQAELLLNQNLGSCYTDYSELVPDTCLRLVGSKYALLRPEFAASRDFALERRETPELSQLMISMGGTDAVDATSAVLSILRSVDLPKDLRIFVVMGRSAPMLSAVREIAATMPRLTEVLVDVCDMASLMSNSDLAIVAGGSINWERCCLGLPGIVVETADNQSRSVLAMVNAGVALSAGKLTDPSFGDRLKLSFLKMQDSAFRKECSTRAATVCEGDGAVTVAEIMENYDGS